MTGKVFLKKDAPKIGSRQIADMTFKELHGDELIKAIGITDLNELPEGYIAGWASTSEVDHYRHVVQPGAFDEAISSKGLTGPRGIKLLIQHDSDKPAGAIKVLETRSGKLWIEAQLNLRISYVRDMYEAAKMQGGLSFSVGFFLEEYEFKTDSNDSEYLLIRKGELVEVSVVTFPGNDNAEMTFIKGITDEEAFETVSEFEKALVASGLVKSRNAAQRITRVVKRNTPLFATPTDPPVLETKQDEALDEISAHLRALSLALLG